MSSADQRVDRPALERSSGRLALIVAAILCALAPHVYAAAATEYEVKAAFIYHFTKFVTWPESKAARPLVIGVLGDDPFGAALDQAVEGKQVRGRALTVRRYSKVEDASASDVLFVSSSEEANLAHILKVLDGAPILTVGDMEDFAEDGGMINLTTEGRHVRFEINVQALARNGLKASSQLLRLATIVSETR